MKGLLLVAGCCIKHNDRILLLKEASSGLWGPPAGHLEEGESLMQAAVRETKEETKLDVKITGLIQSAVIKIPDGRTYIATFYSATANNLKLIKVQPSEILEYDWASKEEVKSNKFEFRKKFLKDVVLKSFSVSPSPIDTFSIIETE